MYLVLLALLAMNVSKEILNSFVIINDGLERTNEGFDIKNAYTMQQFGNKNALDPEKVRKYYLAARQVRDLSKELDAHIEVLKVKIIAGVEQISEDTAATRNLMQVSAKDNHDMPTHMLIGSDANKPINGEFTALELQRRLENFNTTIHDYISEVLPTADVEGMDLAVKMEEVKEGDQMTPWIIGNFYHMPLASVITNMTRIQAEVKNIESEVLRTLYSKISADDFSFDKLKVAVRPVKGTYVTLGDTFKAEVLMAAISTTSDPKLDIGQITDSVDFVIENPDSTKVRYENGIATYFTVPTTPGEYEWGGVLRVQKPNGQLMNYPFTSTYTAAKPSLVISPTKMNVFYRGLDNPVAVAVPGVTGDKLQVAVSNAQVRRDGNEYIINPGKDKECKVTVTAEINGSKTTFPPQIFRVKRVPPPTPEVLGQKGTVKFSKGKAATIKFIVAKLDDFLFDLKYIVTSFKMSVTVGGKVSEFSSKNNQLTPQMLSTIKAMSPGQFAVFKEVQAKMVGGKSSAPVNLDGNIILEIK
jgi:gliding motility-associated protein GldM